MTHLQQINNILKEYIKIPLSIFYKSILAFTIILFIAIWILTIPSFSKLASMIILEILFIFTGLLFYGNYKEKKISKDLEEYREFESQIMKSNDLENKEYSEIIGEIEPLKIDSHEKENEINKNFIA
jgi:uncharacterized membrane protein